MLRRRALWPLSVGAALSLGAVTMSGDARACGGCFTQAGSESTIVTAHRMALSISTARTVLWDQIQYQGSPEEFAWVLPVRPGTIVELGSDAFFEALETVTSTRVFGPVTNVMCNAPTDEYNDYYYTGCSITGCGSGPIGDRPGDGIGTIAPQPVTPPVEVVHEDSIGPYEAVVLSSNKAGALYDWLLSHGYGLDPSMEPVVDDYEAEGFDFVALRLIPGVDVRQMRPVRVISPGASPVLPLRMVAAGTGANVAMTLFVLGEGRWEADNFANGFVDSARVMWDFATNSSNYGELRAEALAANQGFTWVTTSAENGIFYSAWDPVNNTSTPYLASDGQTASNLADLYFLQGAINDPSNPRCTVSGDLPYSSARVVEECPPPGTGGEGGMGGVGGMTGSGGMGGVGGMTGMGGVAGSTNSAGAGGSGGAGGMTGSGGMGGVGGMTGSGGMGGVGGGECVHAPCSHGAPLAAECDPCVTSVCSVDAYCCQVDWDGACIELVGLYCAQACASECAPVAGRDEIPSSALACGDLDDLAVAMVGMHPSSVWFTRLEANLPHEALAQDLVLRPAIQSQIASSLYSYGYTGDPCNPGVGAAAVRASPGERRPPRNKPFGSPDLLAVALSTAALLGAAARRALRKTSRIQA